MAEDSDFEHDPEHEEPARARPPFGGLRRRGIYLLPNLFTTGVLFCGFYAIVQAMNERFEVAAMAIFVAMVLDAMDGRVARWTQTQSEFGAQYDSIADMVAFGAAPALIAYEWALKDLGTGGWIGAFIYCAGTGIRLARFNANIGVVDKRFFQGLPSPSGAAVITGFVWMLTDFELQPGDYLWLAGLAWLVAVFAGVTMVSNVPFYSFKDVNWKKRVPLWAILACVAAFSVIASRPSLVLFVLFFGYALSGYVMWAMGQRVRPVLPEE
ncbi:MAG TPA: phosphatidylcholine/phosphatidylserine synthase [Burkholderiales bacterium]|jgi:CDP-diacylglycerol--serine O-phosphatidyltransferase|nr:phosphatidylcholine/phosphatidylserine synthase [Burkholderiales bacterium]